MLAVAGETLTAVISPLGPVLEPPHAAMPSAATPMRRVRLT
jgi:hypothetical protein